MDTELRAADEWEAGDRGRIEPSPVDGEDVFEGVYMGSDKTGAVWNRPAYAEDETCSFYDARNSDRLAVRDALEFRPEDGSGPSVFVSPDSAPQVARAVVDRRSKSVTIKTRDGTDWHTSRHVRKKYVFEEQGDRGAAITLQTGDSPGVIDYPQWHGSSTTHGRGEPTLGDLGRKIERDQHGGTQRAELAARVFELFESAHDVDEVEDLGLVKGELIVPHYLGSVDIREWVAGLPHLVVDESRETIHVSNSINGPSPVPDAADDLGLTSLPGVGPATAETIRSQIDLSQPPESVDWTEADGVGPATASDIRSELENRRRPGFDNPFLDEPIEAAARGWDDEKIDVFVPLSRFCEAGRRRRWTQKTVEASTRGPFAVHRAIDCGSNVYTLTWRTAGIPLVCPAPTNSPGTTRSKRDTKQTAWAIGQHVDNRGLKFEASIDGGRSRLNLLNLPV